MKKLIFTLLVAVSSIASQAYNTINITTTGKGSPIIIIHGLGGSEVWKNAIQTLSVGHSCYLVSIKGIAGDKNPIQPNLENILKDIIDFIHQQNISNPVLMGHSFGGFVAEQLVINNPSTFKKLVLIDAFPFSMVIYNPAFTIEIGAKQAEMFKNQMNALTDKDYSDVWAQKTKSMVTDTIIQKIVYTTISNSERSYIIEAQRLLLTTDLREKIKEVKCPILVLTSSYIFKKIGLTDEQIKQRTNEQFKDNKDCNILINDNAKHFIMQDSKDWFIENLKKFI
jgi:pimeloyl-ACP methyl ester carboxylesterase